MGANKNILDSIGELFMRYGIKSVSMDDVSRHLGISKKTLYALVENKSDLVGQIVHRHLDKEKEEIEQIRQAATDPIGEMLAIARLVSNKLRAMNPAVLYDLEKYYSESWKAFQSLHQEYVFGVIKRNIAQGMATGLYRGDLNPEVIARLYVGKSFMLVDETIFPSSTYNRAELLREFISYHIHGIASPQGLDLLAKYVCEKP